jgi:hypothetical protein
MQKESEMKLEAGGSEEEAEREEISVRGSPKRSRLNEGTGTSTLCPLSYSTDLLASHSLIDEESSRTQDVR